MTLFSGAFLCNWMESSLPSDYREWDLEHKY